MAYEAATRKAAKMHHDQHVEKLILVKPGHIQASKLLHGGEAYSGRHKHLDGTLKPMSLDDARDAGSTAEREFAVLNIAEVTSSSDGQFVELDDETRHLTAAFDTSLDEITRAHETHGSLRAQLMQEREETAWDAADPRVYMVRNHVRNPGRHPDDSVTGYQIMQTIENVSSQGNGRFVSERPYFLQRPDPAKSWEDFQSFSEHEHLVRKKEASLEPWRGLNIGGNDTTQAAELDVVPAVATHTETILEGEIEATRWRMQQRIKGLDKEHNKAVHAAEEQVKVLPHRKHACFGTVLEPGKTPEDAEASDWIGKPSDREAFGVYSESSESYSKRHLAEAEGARYQRVLADTTANPLRMGRTTGYQRAPGGLQWKGAAKADANRVETRNAFQEIREKQAQLEADLLAEKELQTQRSERHPWSSVY